MLKEGIVVKEGILVKESVLVKEGFNPIEIKEAVNPVPHPASSLSSPLLTEKNESMNSELMNLEPTSPSDAANITPPATVHLPEMGVFEVPTPPKIAAQRAIRRYHQASTTFPDILTNSSTLLVHTWDTSSPPLHLHASMFHYYLLKLEIVNDTVIFPTACFEAAGLLLRYFYNIGVVEKEVIDAAPLFVLMELAVLAGRLKTVQLLKSLLPVLTQRVKTAGVEELAKYTRTKLEFDADMAKEGISGNRFPGTVECWLANG